MHTCIFWDLSILTSSRCIYFEGNSQKDKYISGYKIVTDKVMKGRGAWDTRIKTTQDVQQKFISSQLDRCAHAKMLSVLDKRMTLHAEVFMMNDSCKTQFCKTYLLYKSIFLLQVSAWCLVLKMPILRKPWRNKSLQRKQINFLLSFLLSISIEFNCDDPDKYIVLSWFLLWLFWT